MFLIKIAFFTSKKSYSSLNKKTFINLSLSLSLSLVKYNAFLSAILESSIKLNGTA